MAFKHAKQARRRLTSAPRYSSVLHVTTGYRANRAQCSSTLHGSNPTLVEAVNGLRCIVLSRRLLVLRSASGPTDSPVGLGRFGFPVEERRY
jgi:hypothetical protein